MGERVQVGSYYDVVQAQLARSLLEGNGIDATVIEAAAFNPLLSDVAGGVRLEVDALDEERALAILKRSALAVDDDRDENVVRCPRCELQYCFFERPRIVGATPAAAGSIAIVFVSALLWFLPKRWCCHKCGHVWKDASEGPKRITALQKDDPKPVFRLRRAHAGMGLFIGLILGTLVSFFGVQVNPAMRIALVALPLVGFLLGRSMTYDVCSAPECRKLLPSGEEECSSCKGSVAGQIREAHEHYSAAADFRRELAAAHALDAKALSKPKKKRANLL
jgi:hypothetical protein